MSETSTAVLVGLGAIGLTSLAMWGLDKASSRTAAFGLAPAYRDVPPTLRSPGFEDDEPETERMTERMADPETERMEPSWSGVRTLRDPHDPHDLLHEPSPPTTLRKPTSLRRRA